MKKKILFTAVFAVFTAFLALTAHADDITVTVNGSKVESDAPAMIVEDRTLVPLRAVSNALNCAVGWDGDNRGIIVYSADIQTYEEQLAFCWIDKPHAFSLKENALENLYEMDVPPMLINDRTYVPIRAVSELLGAEVDWDGETRTVIISAELPDNIAEDTDAESLIPFETALYDKYDAYSSFADGTSQTIRAEIDLENGGKIVLDLYPELAPETVSNFVKLAKEGFYDGLIFHRVISGFMVQGGGIDADGNSKETDTIYGEFLANGFINLLPHDRGVISMARTMASMDSASSQFFIMHADYPSLNGNYAAFGSVISGMEYVDAIAAAETDENDRPLENQMIKSITISE